MNTEEAIKHFNGRKALAEALGITLPALCQPSWDPEPPWPRQIEIERLTDGALKAGPKPPPKVLGKRKQRAKRKGKR